MLVYLFVSFSSRHDSRMPCANFFNLHIPPSTTKLTFICKFLYRLNFLSINRFERKKNIDLAISAFAMLRTLEGDALGGQNFADASLTIAGNFSFFPCQVRL